jgi:hypothetical protein
MNKEKNVQRKENSPCQVLWKYEVSCRKSMEVKVWKGIVVESKKMPLTSFPGNSGQGTNQSF